MSKVLSVHRQLWISVACALGVLACDAPSRPAPSPRVTASAASMAERVAPRPAGTGAVEAESEVQALRESIELLADRLDALELARNRLRLRLEILEQDAQPSGTLSVFGVTNSQIYIDGRLVALTAPETDLALAPGHHAVRLYDVDTKRFSETRGVDIEAGHHVNVDFREPITDAQQYRPQTRAKARTRTFLLEEELDAAREHPLFDVERVDGRVALRGIAEGSAAYELGLRDDDVLLSIDAVDAVDEIDPSLVVDRLTDHGVVVLAIERDGHRHSIQLASPRSP